MTETTSSGIKLSFQTKGNYKYAKVPGISYRENGKIRKKGTIYLGRVIDEKNFIFFSKDANYPLLRSVFLFSADQFSTLSRSSDLLHSDH